jgi:cysteine desulfurase / selenocysteine lyase
VLPSELRALFPITATRAYLFSGGLAPAAQPVKAALDEWTDRWTYDPAYHRAHYFDEWERVRERLARIIGADADEIALTDNTSRGSNLIAQMIDAPPGGNVVVDETTYPSSLYHWRLPHRSGVEVRRAPSVNGRVDIDSIARLVDGRTVAVSVSHVSALTGFRHDLARLGEVAHQRGAYLVVDAAQSAGAVQIDVKAMGVDFLSGTLMKWLLGPPGLGFMFVAREHADRQVPPQVGYVGAELLTHDEHGEASEDLSFKPGARRHELGLASLPALPACRRGLDLLLDVGMRRVEEHVLELSGRCIEGLCRRDLRPTTPLEPEHRAGVIAFRFQAAEAMAAFVRRRGVDVWGYPNQRVRVDPHVFNNADDVDRFLDGLDTFISEYPSEDLSEEEAG